MHRHGLFFMAALAVVGLSAAPALADQPTFDTNTAPLFGPSPALRNLAPMDREFGQLRMTPLGIANTLAASGSRFSDTSTREELTTGSFAFAIDALRDWQRSFPHDPLVAKDLGKVVHIYARLHSDAARELAGKAVSWLERDYPQTLAARDAREEFEVASEDAVPPAVDATFTHIEHPGPALPPPPENAWQRYDVARGNQ